MKTWQIYLLAFFAALIAITLGGCSKGDRAAMSAWGKPHEVTCFSGGIVIYHGYSTGKISNEHQSDGYYFEDRSTHSFVTVSGNCVITLEEK